MHIAKQQEDLVEWNVGRDEHSQLVWVFTKQTTQKFQKSLTFLCGGGMHPEILFHWKLNLSAKSHLDAKSPQLLKKVYNSEKKVYKSCKGVFYSSQTNGAFKTENDAGSTTSLKLNLSMDQPLWLIIFQMHGMSTGSWNWALGLSNKILCWTNEQRDYKQITPLNLTSVTWYLTNILVWACGYVFLLRRFPLVLVVRVKSIRSVARDWRRSLHCEDQSSTCN